MVAPGANSLIVALLVGLAALASCSQEVAPSTSFAQESSETTASSTDFPDVLEVEVETDGPGTFRFDVTVSSPYDSEERYADAWRVKDAEGTVYGVRELLHHHANEQPFTRSLDGVAIPAEVDTVIVEGRDSANGWGGDTIEVRLPNG